MKGARSFLLQLYLIKIVSSLYVFIIMVCYHVAWSLAYNIDSF